MKRKGRKAFWHNIKFKYKLTIINENTLEEVVGIHVSKLNGLSVLLAASTVIFLIAASIIAFTPLRNYLPGYMNSELRTQVVTNALRADSLEEALARQNHYIMNIRDILSGEVKADTVKSIDSLANQRAEELMERTAEEDAFRKKYEERERYNLTAVNDAHSAIGLNFRRPTRGVMATNFNPEINLREVSANGSYWTDGHWVETKPMEWRAQYNFDQVGEKDMYLLHHEEIESLAKNIPGIKRIRFFMTFGQSYLTHMKCLENVGMLRTDPIMVDGKEIVPIQVLKELLPDPASLGPRTVGKTNIGCIFTGVKDGKEKSIYIYNVCDHQECYKEVESQAISYTTGVPAMIGAMMVVKGLWKKPGVFNLEEMDPDPYMEALNKFGLPWQVVENPVPVDCYKTEDESVHMD